MISFSKKEHYFTLGLFTLLWLYIIIRAFTVFYVHDEIVSKWAYMIDWNYIPYEGYIDANNHFLNSFLGGLFIRLFNSDSIFIVRLANVLAFPIFFWSIVAFKEFFQKKANFFLFLIGISCTHFILDFYSLARGYGLAWSFMLFALYCSAKNLKSTKTYWTLLTVVAWILCIYANLSYLPLSVIGIVYMLLYSLYHKKVFDSLLYLSSAIPIYYFLAYSLQLQSIGKLYLGSANDFFKTVVHPLSEYIFFTASIFIDAVVLIMCIGVVVYIFKRLLKEFNIFTPTLLFPILFCLTIASVFVQNWILDINYPENRSATHLYILLIGAIAFISQDERFKKLIYALILILFGFFCSHLNFNNTQVYAYEHFDPKLLTKIPEYTEGIPTSTGGRFWTADNELARTLDLPLRSNQDSPKPSDTIVDYLITFEEVRPNILDTYHEVYVDELSELTLYKRNKFLKREKKEENTVVFDNKDLYINLISDLTNRPCFIRCKGKLEGMNIYKDPVAIFTVEDSLSNEKLLYQGVGFSSNAKIDENGEIHFDFSFAIKNYPTAKMIKVYIYNKKMVPLKGSITTEVYDISF